MLEATGFGEVVVGDPVDTFGDSPGEDKARSFEVYGFSFLARRH
jgi:hypothetical protein